MIEDPKVTFVGYRVPHPLNTNIEIRVRFFEIELCTRYKLSDLNIHLVKLLQSVVHVL